jgi:hypothetical protein
MMREENTGLGELLVYKTEIVREGCFTGTIEDFRALMHEILLLQPDFKPDTLFLQEERTPSDYPRLMARWEITLGASCEQRGYILARQLPDGTTKLQVAYNSKYKPIGPQFDVEYVDRVLQSVSHGLTMNKSTHNQEALGNTISGGINIHVDGDLNVDGDIVGRNKSVSGQQSDVL